VITVSGMVGTLRAQKAWADELALKLEVPEKNHLGHFAHGRLGDEDTQPSCDLCYRTNNFVNTHEIND
jgi:hypothetical protein